jgi:hypothetical protein
MSVRTPGLRWWSTARLSVYAHGFCAPSYGKFGTDVGTASQEASYARRIQPERERQYEHIKDSAEKRGVPTKRATEIAARTVNKERARAGESRTASRSSIQDVSSGHRGGKRSHTGAQGRTKEQLYNEAKQRNIKGRSTMSKAQLEKALAR